MNSQVEDQLNLFRKRVIEINNLFSDLRPMIFAIHLLALNGEVACAKMKKEGSSFSRIALDLRLMGKELSDLVDDIESEFFKIVKRIGTWGQTEYQVRLYGASLELMQDLEQQTMQKDPSEDSFSELEGFPQKPKNSTTQKQETTSDKLLLNRQHILQLQVQAKEKIYNNLLEIFKNIFRLDKLITSINRVAVRKSHFISILSLIEARRLDGLFGSKLVDVAERIKILNTEIAEFENLAKGNILSLMHQASSLENKLQNL